MKSKKTGNKTKHSTVNTKAKTTSSKKKQSAGVKISNLTLFLILGFIAILVVSYFTIGTLMTAFLGVGILIIVGVARLLDKMKSKPKQRKIVNIILIVCLALAILALILACCFFAYIAIKAPKFDPKDLERNEMSILYDIDGNEYAKLGGEMRTKISYEQLPQVFVDALVATEDSRFFQHNGFDAPRFLKASLGQLVGKSDAGGASTISMQVIKNSFTGSESHGLAGIIRKFTDIYLAIFKLEKNYTKEQILEFYVNNHLLGGNIWGVQQAARAYFSKDIQDLNLSEAATLAGMFKSPNYYRPHVNPKNATARRATVLYLMEKHGYITKEEREAAAAIPMEDLVNVNTKEMTTGNTEYQGYIDTVVAELENKYKVNPYETPLLIYTNMDRSKQDGVNRVMNGESYAWANDVIQGGVSVLDTGSGKIQAIGAGRAIGDRATGVNNYNFAVDMHRQPGSTAKPLFDYGPGMEYYNWSTYGINDGEDNYSTIVDEPYSYSNGQQIRNWDLSYMGNMTIRRALSLSRNVPALKAFQTVSTSENGAGNKKILEFVTNLGLTTEADKNNGKLHEAHSIGAFDPGVSPLELSAAYAAFGNGGTYYEPYSVERFVYRADGKEVKHEEVKRKAMSDSTAFMITSILQNVAIYGSPIDGVAAKTGTTNYDSNAKAAYGMSDDAIRDSWVVGYTTKTIIGMWYGYKDASTAREGFYCHNVACSNQKDKLFRALADEVFEKNKGEFKAPDSVVGMQMGSSYEYFKKDHEPKKTVVSKLPTPTGLKASYASNKVSITWNAVDPGETNESYGEFGYNVYFNNTLLGFTTKTSYTVNNPSEAYGTYKVVALFKKYNGNQSDAATFNLAKPKANLTIGPASFTIESGATVASLKNHIIVKEDGSDITSSITVNAISVDGQNMAMTNVLSSGTHSVKFTFTYKGETRTSGTISVVVKESSGGGTGSEDGDETGGEEEKPTTP